VDVINRVEFSAKNLTSNAGLFLLLEHARRNGIFDLIDHDLVFETQSTNRIKMNHIKEAKYDMAVGHLLLKSFWSHEAIFQLMMLAYNLFLLFKIDMVKTTEYRQQIKTFRLKYVFLAGKIIRTARSVVMKLSDRYPYREMYEQSLSG
jgi:hypothetical protein